MAKITRTSAQVLQLRQDSHEEAVTRVMQWLVDRHRKAWRMAFDALLDLLKPEDAQGYLAEDLEDDEDLMRMLTVNVSEWLIARGDMFAKGEMRSINAHLLGRDGPYLSPQQQGWIAQLAERPLRLYRVTDVRLGDGLTLVDELDSAAEPLVVQERSGSQSMKPGMLLGARVMQLSDHLELSGAIYVFAALREGDVIAQVRTSLDAGLHPANNMQLAELAIARCWLAQWFEPMPVPEMHDAGTGDPILLVTDHYRLVDAAKLSATLAAQPDVSGDPEDGWHRDSDAGDGMRRSLAAINPGKSADRIEIFYRTQRLADEGRAWFEALAAGTVMHLTREVVDPRSAAAREAARGKARPVPDLEPEAVTEAIEQFLRRQYANWADEPVPLLGNVTPRQAMATPAGLERVKGLLRSYENGEAEMAQRDGRPPVPYQFLWG